MLRDMNDVQELVDRFVSLWNEPDADVRSKLIRELWAPDGGQILADVPQEIRDAARGLNFPIPSLEVWGYEALEARVTRAYEMFVAGGEYVFTPAPGQKPSRLLDHVITYRWKMTRTEGGEAVGGGVDVFHLDPDGRIRTDYQFIER